MRRVRHALLSVASLCLAALPALADDPYAEYRIPEHRWLSWSGNLTADGNRSGGSYYGEQRESGDLRGSGGTALTSGFDSDARSHLYSLRLALSGDRSHATADAQSGDFLSHNDGSYQSANEAVYGFLGYSRYLQAIPVGLSLGVNGALALAQSWNAQDEHRIYPPFETRFTQNYTSGGYNAAAALTASLDFGRVRDATPVYQVQVLEQRLLEVGTITRPLSTAARQRLASLYTVESDVAFAHQRPTKYFWRELERLLGDDGALGAEGLDAYAVQRLLEPLTIVGSGAAARARGFAFGPQVMLHKNWGHTSYDASSSRLDYQNDTLTSNYDASRTEKRDTHSDDILSGLFVDYHRPIGMRWQVDALSQGLITEMGQTIHVASRLGVNWLVADRWFATAGVQQSLEATKHEDGRKPQPWSVDYGASVNYFLEDAWAFRLGWSGHQENTFQYSHRDAITLGVTYQFAGWLSAPAVFAPMRLTPPGD